MELPFASRLPDVDRTRRSPNHGARAPKHERPDCLVLHYTGMRDGPSAIDRLCDPAAQVSSHYVVTEAGDILQLVDEADRAWCCGRSVWQGLTDLNSASVNIEIVNGGHDFGLPPYPEAQIASVIRLCHDIMERHRMAPARLLAHSDIAPGRKQDPGERFPWKQLARVGLGLWPDDEGCDDPGTALGPNQAGEAVAALQADLARWGYGLPINGIYDAETVTVVRAFQRRFRPDLIDGTADRETRRRLARLLARL
jgi:N-acetylmuramoyl-L-alanine amidase